MNLQEKLSAAEVSLDSIETTDDCIKYGLNTNLSEKEGIRGIIALLKNGEEAHTVCINIRNFFDLFEIATEENNNRCYIIKPNHKGIQPYENELWYPNLCFLLENGYCTIEKEYKYPIFNACSKLSLTVSYRSYFGLDYIVSCGEFDRYTLKRYDCLAYFLEKAKSDLNEYSADTTWKAPKTGMLIEWAAAAFRYERLRQMIDEIYHHHRDFEGIVKVYIGTIGGYGFGVTKTEDPHSYITHVNFDVEYTSNTYSGLEDTVILDIDHHLGIEWFVNNYHDIERHKRYDEGKSTVLRAYVDSINYIRRLEWVEV